MNLTKQRLVNAIDKKVIKVWFIWGYDLYSNWPQFKHQIYDSDTLLFLNNRKSVLLLVKSKLIFNKFSYFLFSAFRNKKFLLPNKINVILENNYFTEFYKAIQKVDIVVPVVPNEYDLIKK